MIRAGTRMCQALNLEASAIVGSHLSLLFNHENLMRVPSDHEVGRSVLEMRLGGTAAFGNTIVESNSGGVRKSWRIAAYPVIHWRPKIGWRGVATDVSESRGREAEGKTREATLYHLAMHDALTRLPNRRAFPEKLAAVTSSRPAAPRRPAPSAIAFVDLDNFKKIDDIYGHGVGDIALERAAHRLRQALSPADFLACLGGDEFVVLMLDLPSLDSGAEVEFRSKLIHAHLQKPERIADYSVDLKASIGIAYASGQAGGATGVMRRADVTLHVSKRTGRNTSTVYLESMEVDLDPRMSSAVATPAN